MTGAPARSCQMRDMTPARLSPGMLAALLVLIITTLGCQGDSTSNQTDNASETIDPRAAELAAAELPAERQQEIWQAEHVTFEIERRFGFAWLNAFANRDHDRLVGYFLPDADVRMSLVLEPEVSQAGVSEINGHPIDSDHPADDTATTFQADSPESMVSQWLSWTESYQQVLGKSLRVLHIRQLPDTPGGWWTEVLVTIKGKDAQGQYRQIKWLQEVEFVFNEEDEDALDEIASISSWHVDKVTDRTSGQELFTEVTEAVGLSDDAIPDNWECEVKQTQQYRFQYAVEDFDGDGQLDIAVAQYDGKPLLYRRYPDGSYQDVAEARGLGLKRNLENFCCSWIDLEGDGDFDLIMGERVYQNDNGLFSDVTARSQLVIEPLCMGAIPIDYDLDGDLDVYVLYQVEIDQVGKQPARWVDEQLSGKANQLWRNQGDGVFENVTAETGAGGGARHTHAAAWFHLNDDPYPDLYIANDFGQNVVLANSADGTFQDVTLATQAGGFSTSMGVATGDLDNNGTNEIYVANMFSKMGRRIIAYVSDDDYPEGIYAQIQGSCAGNQLFSQSGSQQFKELSEQAGVNGVGWAFGPAMADFDNDGLLDIYATTGFMSFDRTKPDG